MTVDRYHSPKHIAAYDAKYIGLPGGELEQLATDIDLLLSAKEELSMKLGIHKMYVRGDQFISMFICQYLRADRSAEAWPLEQVKMGIERTRFLGTNALKECYKIKLDSSILQGGLNKDGTLVSLDNRMTTIFNISNIEDDELPYSGLVLRPNFVDGTNITDEPMTAYDCTQLSDSVNDVHTIAHY